MKILQISTGTMGGAAIACLRLHRQLQATDISSKVLCLKDAAGAGEQDHNIVPYINKKKSVTGPTAFFISYMI